MLPLLQKQRKHRRYTWVGNKIPPEVMAELFRIKTEARRPITELVAEAVSMYVKLPKCSRE